MKYIIIVINIYIYNLPNLLLHCYDYHNDYDNYIKLIGFFDKMSLIY